MEALRLFLKQHPITRPPISVLLLRMSATKVTHYLVPLRELVERSEDGMEWVPAAVSTEVPSLVWRSYFACNNNILNATRGLRSLLLIECTGAGR